MTPTPSGRETPDHAAHFYPIPADVAADPKLSGNAKLLYGALCYHGRNAERRCYPSQETLSSECGVSVQIVSRRLAELRDAGYISWTRTNRTNIYELLVPQNWGSDPLPAIDRIPQDWGSEPPDLIDPIPQNRRSDPLPVIGPIPSPVIGKERRKKEEKKEDKTEARFHFADVGPRDISLGVEDDRFGDHAWKKLTEDYPGTQDTEASYRQWMSELDMPTAEEIADALKAWGEAEQWTTERGRYIPKMSNWIRNRGWLDKPPRRKEESTPYQNYEETQEMLKRSGPIRATPPEESEEEIEEMKKTAERIGIKWDGPTHPDIEPRSVS